MRKIRIFVNYYIIVSNPTPNVLLAVNLLRMLPIGT